MKREENPMTYDELKAQRDKFRDALVKIAAEAFVPIDQLPDYGQPNGWRDVACARIDMAREALAIVGDVRSAN